MRQAGPRTPAAANRGDCGALAGYGVGELLSLSPLWPTVCHVGAAVGTATADQRNLLEDDVSDLLGGMPPLRIAQLVLIDGQIEAGGSHGVGAI